ncbi:MAG TPA: peptidylprolyl isomerase [Spirochaetota bacterium]|nr:MAG: Chaperone SurA [Spirochaetes bacterium ADurb.Bin133]HNZ25766.1 peptidylprolyl isomerase [Spirochaetota bacterium]HOF00096.1 peptidylprolyl isomerase [Spirochaetota bacterium]HOS31874.1 peptidylprolyl isomerase [Spirochaetota bacterium]HOS54461.1 peptidylprolyl isomerase [Spirochaetota bacterium]
MKRSLAVIFFVVSLFSLKSLDFNDLSDDFLLVKVGKYDITVLDFKLYILGYGSIDRWDIYSVEDVLNTMIMDLLFYNACEEEKITVSEDEIARYAEKYFTDRSVAYDNPQALQLYFDMNDPYSSIEDFYMKTTYNLMKIKYLAKRNHIKQVKSCSIFFSTEKLSKKDIALKKEAAVNLANKIYSGQESFFSAVKLFSEDSISKEKNGDIGTVSDGKESKKIFKSVEIKKILQAGLFFPIFIEGTKGYHIVMNYDYVFPDDEKYVSDILLELSDKYKVIKMVDINPKK